MSAHGVTVAAVAAFTVMDELVELKDTFVPAIKDRAPVKVFKLETPAAPPEAEKIKEFPLGVMVMPEPCVKLTAPSKELMLVTPVLITETFEPTT
jgi:hypothetical protein